MKITLIYLAAGNSRRFGSNKLFYEIEGKVLYLHALERLAAICRRHADWNLLVVTQYQEIFDKVQKMGLGTVFSPDSRKGVSYSIEAALRAETNRDAYAFFVADQPFLTGETAEGFLMEMERSGAKLGSVCYREMAGNPTWFTDGYREELLALEGDCGGRTVLKRHSEEVVYYEIPVEKELCDIDCPLVIPEDNVHKKIFENMAEKHVDLR